MSATSQKIAMAKPVKPKKAAKRDLLPEIGMPIKIGKTGLNMRQELFCLLYAGTSEYFGNGSQAYMAAYDIRFEPQKELPKIPNESDEEGMAMYVEEKERVMKENEAIAIRNEGKRNGATVNACRLLMNTNIVKVVNEVRINFMTDEKVDFEMAKVLNQDGDLPSKMRAIEQHNKLRGRIVELSKNLEQRTIIGIIKHVYENTDAKNAKGKKDVKRDITHLIE